MDDQAEMTGTSDDRARRSSRGAGGFLAHFFCDLVELAELQGLLFLADSREEFRKARAGLLLLAAFAGIGASCVPLALAGAALFLADATSLTVGQAMLCVAGLGIPIAGAGIYGAARWAAPGHNCLERSRAEWRCNVTWMKETLAHLRDGPRSPRLRPGPRS